MGEKNKTKYSKENTKAENKNKEQIVFGHLYSQIYDALYKDKDYQRECDYLEELFKMFRVRVRKILDLGCGTGNHSIELAKRGYEVIGIDISEKMITIATEKLKNLNKRRIKFIRDDIRNFSLNERFDAVISMFAVIGYINENDDLIKTFSNVREHLKEDGIFIFDVWFGPAVINLKPTQKVKEIDIRESEKIFRITTPKLDVMRHIVEVNFKVIYIKENKLHIFEENHKMRFFFPKELELMLKISGFKRVYFFPFLETERKPDENDWNITAVSLKK
jgi:SAM-dependent methyltransferase